MFAPRYFAPTYFGPRYFPPDFIDDGLTGPRPGGGSSKKPWVRAPGRDKNYEIARYEDEEIVAILQAMLSSRTKN